MLGEGRSEGADLAREENAALGTPLGQRLHSSDGETKKRKRKEAIERRHRKSVMGKRRRREEQEEP